jgi:tRNA-(ms[2]io[6]A)-hydroxylase
MKAIREDEIAADSADLLADLPLTAPTRPGWVEVAIRDLGALLIDHAHCELKAAANSVAMAGRFPEETLLVRDLTRLAREELRHFDLVHRLVRDGGKVLGPPAADRYVRALSRLVRRGGGRRREALIDQLILCGFIEARSCERFRLLATAPLESPLRTFYAELAGAEARHHELFFGHARRLGGEAARARIRFVAGLEGELIASLPPEPRMH